MEGKTGSQGARDEFGIPMGLRIDTGIWELPDEEFPGEDWQDCREDGQRRLPDPLKVIVMGLCVLTEVLLAYAWATGADWPLFTGAVLMAAATVIGVTATRPGRRSGSAGPG